ncbi:hypothetical protein [Granulicella sibirica]|uniref:Uncharacterized protein n=1 Tax=Granulicella sibirica TaxID=2479048 RepID=A0A4V1L541_9BACT|nr:hypothetical protein [Granulicella sibirica]RXH54444.1 hypothetical protein GRAN_4740 [Granulicella sibirica]
MGTQWKIDWPKMGPSILIATALIVAIRTAKWAAKAAGDPLISDVDNDLDREVSYAACITIRVMHELMKKHESLFPGKREPIFDGIHDEDVAE